MAAAISKSRVLAKSGGFTLGTAALFALLLTSCDALQEPYQELGWATTRITSDFCNDVATGKEGVSFNRCVFPSRDEVGNVYPEGEVLDAATLNSGREAYMHYCYACHGVNGDGKGPASHGLRPPPRDFRIHTYKFAAVKEGLPNDWDMMRIVKGGLHGSAMLEWDIPDYQLGTIIDFIKTFPPPPCDPGSPPTESGTKKCAKEAEDFPNGKPNAWQERFMKDAKLFAKGKGTKAKATGVPVYVPEVDPYAGKIEEALKKGAELYHLRAQCVNCHPAYVTKADFARMLKKDNPSFRNDMYFSKVILAKDNVFAVNIMPPDFTMNRLRSIRSRERDANGEWVPVDQVRELWRLIASGIAPTGMPSWKDSIKDDEIWALSHYVKYLMDLRMPANKAARKALHDALDKQKAFTPKPKPKEEKKDDAEPAGSASASASASAGPSAPPATSAAPGASAPPAKAPPAKGAPKAAPPKAAPPKTAP